MSRVFRNAMFGFHKNDVAAFISKQNRQFEKRISDLEKEKAVLIQDYENQIGHLSFEREELEQFRQKKEDDLATLSAIRVLCNKIQSGNQQVVDSFRTTKEDIARLEQFALRLNEKLVESQVLREKANRFDQLASVLSGIVAGKESTIVAAKNANDEEFSSNVEAVEKIELDRLQNAFNELAENCNELVRVLTAFVDER